MSFEERPSPKIRIGGALAAAVAVVLQSLWLAAWYPAAYLDADLLSYLSYFRDLRSGATAAFGYTVPKVLPVMLLGPFGSPEAAFVVSVLVAGIGGALVFAIAAETFGVVAAVLASVAYVFDPLRSVLTVRSSADLYVGVALLAAMWALLRRAPLAVGAAVLVAALAKPLAAVCGFVVLAMPGVPLSRRLVAVLVPFLAIPAAVALDAGLDGRSVLAAIFSMKLPDEHAQFVRVAEGKPLDWRDTLQLVFSDWFGKLLFARTWLLVLIGAAVYAVRTRAREAGESADAWLAVLAIPLLLTAAYVGLATLEPFVFFMRFLWILSVAATILAAYGAAAIASRAPVPSVARAGLLAVFAAALLADRWDDFRWREPLMLAPFEKHARIAERGVAMIADEHACDGAAVVPLAYLPLAAWRVPGKLHRGELCATEDWAAGRGCAEATCMLVIPEAPTTAPAREAAARALEEGWMVQIEEPAGAALVRAKRDGEAAAASRVPPYRVG
ncbi:MAG: hypothetical protein FJ144_01555 [Deltaproteobacteria bacterium]|nr:hypothetical protein [Deltaproteobacteria bacterium]